jgi:hypothetical protein
VDIVIAPLLATSRGAGVCACSVCSSRGSVHTHTVERDAVDSMQTAVLQCQCLSTLAAIGVEVIAAAVFQGRNR